MSLDTTATPAGAATPDPAKLFVTLQALAAHQLGVSVASIEGDDGRPEFIVSRGAYCKRCRSIQELGDLLARMGARIP